jgi:glycerol kinase
MAGTPISGSVGDQQAATLGQRCKVGEAKSTFGTGCFLLLNTGDTAVPSTHGLLTTTAFQLGPGERMQYALEGSVAIAGAGVAFLRDNLGIIEKVSDVEELAGRVSDTGGVYFVPAFGGLLAPHWRDDARGLVVGLTQYSKKEHIARAMLEAVCFQSVDVRAHLIPPTKSTPLGRGPFLGRNLARWFLTADSGQRIDEGGCFAPTHTGDQGDAAGCKWAQA